MDQLFDTLAEPTTGRFARVALEQSVDVAGGGLTYAIPLSLADLQVGQRVVVPLGRGNKKVSGYVVELLEESQLEKKTRVKAILSRDAQGLSLPGDLVELAKWMGQYYCTPLGMVFVTMLPAAVKKGTGSVSQTWVGRAGEESGNPKSEIRNPNEDADDAAVDEVPSSLPRPQTPDPRPEPADPRPDDLPRLSRLQRQVLESLRELERQGEPWIEMKRLADLAGARSVAPVRQLIAKGVLGTRQQVTIRAEWDQMLKRVESPQDFALMPAQQEAVASLGRHLHEGFSVHLLHGVTGSGKTEVYLRVIEELTRTERKSEIRNPKSETTSDAAAAGSASGNPGVPGEPGVIVLVPEIALTPQTVARFMGRFANVAVLHSGLSAAQRHEQWHRIRTGQARIVVGARSAIFAPLPGLGLIIVDEEHEPSYKQDQLPRYHARDVAIKRAQLLGIPVLLGSATPSLESFHNATSRANFRLIRLPERVAGYQLPKVEIVDLNAERKLRYDQGTAGQVHLLSMRLEAAIGQTLGAKGQVILLLNRRGYANYIACPDQRCGWMMRCQFCDATMVYHRDQALPTGGLVRCHHCDAEQLLPSRCPVSQHHITVFGLGTQRVEEEISKKFPSLVSGVRMLRMDSDSMRTSYDYYQSLERFRQGEVDLLVGTQMIAKGLDFPNVRLVGVICADTALHMPDFRASERTFQLIAQVAGRAGRGDQPGLVIVQTFSPQDQAIQMASRHDYDGFARRELELRQSVGLPPFGRMARIVVRDKDHLACLEQAQTLATHLNAYNTELKLEVRVRGPMPCAIARIAEYHRQQIEMIAPDAVRLQKLMAALRAAKLLRADARTAVDVDPVTML